MSESEQLRSREALLWVWAAPQTRPEVFICAMLLKTEGGRTRLRAESSSSLPAGRLLVVSSPSRLHSAVTKDAERRGIVWVLRGFTFLHLNNLPCFPCCGFSTPPPPPLHPGKGSLQESIKHVQGQRVRGAVRENHHSHPTGQGCG